MPVTPDALQPLTVSVFPCGFNWPLFVACDAGHFAAERLAVTVLPTTGSVAQMTDFAAGRFDIAITADSLGRTLFARDDQARKAQYRPCDTGGASSLFPSVSCGGPSVW